MSHVSVCHRDGTGRKGVIRAELGVRCVGRSGSSRRRADDGAEAQRRETLPRMDWSNLQQTHARKASVPKTKSPTSVPAVATVRPAVRADSSSWLAMRSALWPESAVQSHAKDIRAYFDGTVHEPLQVLMAVDDEGKVIGLAELSIRNYAEGCETNRVAYLEGWYVEPHSRRRGIGAALLKAAEDWGVAQGCTEFASDSQLDNDVSARAHHALGFQESATIRCFRKSIPRERA